MKLAVMQPYFLPYIGYFQLISAVDVFVVYDKIKYTKKGWINRNRLLRNGADALFSLPLKSDSDALDVVDRVLSPDFEREKLLRQFQGAYQRAPYFSHVFPWLSRVINTEDSNLFSYVHHSIKEVCAYLEIHTPIRVFSELGVDEQLKSQDKVIAICQAVGADTYINPVGGTGLYASADFQQAGITLQFLKSHEVAYPQFGAKFVPWLSIVDVLMFNDPGVVMHSVRTDYELFMIS